MIVKKSNPLLTLPNVVQIQPIESTVFLWRTLFRESPKSVGVIFLGTLNGTRTFCIIVVVIFQSKLPTETGHPTSNFNQLNAM